MGRGTQSISLKLEKAELTFYSWGRVVIPHLQWVTELRFKFLYPLPMGQHRALSSEDFGPFSEEPC